MVRDGIVSLPKDTIGASFAKDAIGARFSKGAMAVYIRTMELPNLEGRVFGWINGIVCWHMTLARDIQEIAICR